MRTIGYPTENFLVGELNEAEETNRRFTPPPLSEIELIKIIESLRELNRLKDENPVFKAVQENHKIKGKRKRNFSLKNVVK